VSFALLIVILLGTIVAVALLAWVATAIAVLIVRAGAAIARALCQRGGHYGR
jgi:hypothetical protein